MLKLDFFHNDLPALLPNEEDSLEGFDPTPMIVGFVLFMAALELPYRQIHLPRDVLIVMAVIALFAILFISLEHHFISLLILAAYLPFSKILAGDFEKFMTGFNLTNQFTAIVVGGWLAQSAFHHRRLFYSSPPDIPVFFFSALALLSLIRGGLGTGEVPISIIIELKQYLTPIFFYYIFSANIRSLRQAKALVAVAVFVTLVAALMGLKESYVDIGAASSWDSMRLRGICEQANNTGAFFTYYSFFFLGYFLLTPRAERTTLTWIWLGCFGACFLAMTRTFSRGAQLSFAITLLFVLAVHNWRQALLALALGTIIITWFPEYIPESMIGRFNLLGTEELSTPDTALDKSASERLIHWRGALVMIRAHPFFGIGYGLYQKQIELFAQAPLGGVRDVHQGLLLIGAEMGLPALIIFMVIMGQFFWAGWYLYRHTSDQFLRSFGLSVMAMTVAVYVANHFGDRLNSQELSSYYWILGATAFAIKRLMDCGVLPACNLPAPYLTVAQRLAQNRQRPSRLPEGPAP